jgi:NADH dehydrogenase (ubiquinone) Fe-S protein 1
VITLFINNYKFLLKPNVTILEACKTANIEIPRFCYHERLSVSGNCRMCLIEVANSPKPVVACTTPVVHGMKIYTNTPLVKKARESVLEVLLINHPLDCPVCDQSGECDLQDQSKTFGNDRSRFYDFKAATEDKSLGNIIKTVMTRCIHCTRCVRFAQEIAGVGILGTLVRGSSTQVGTYLEKIFRSELSGNLADLCPVGALSSKLLTAAEKSWEFDKLNTIDISDGLGSSIRMDFKKNKLVRILPRINTNTNEEWISDKTRFYYDGILNLIETPLIQKSNTTFRGICTYNQLTNYVVKNHSIAFRNENSWLLNECYLRLFIPVIFSNLTYSYNLIKRILKIVSPKHLVAICGAQTAIDAQLSMVDFINKVGSNKVGFEKPISINSDFSCDFKMNTSIRGLSESDLCLFVGVNPRFEASTLNIRLRKRYLKGGMRFMSIGSFSNVTYPVKHLGLGIKTLLILVEGKHFICKHLKKSKNPTVIFNSGLMGRKDSLSVHNVLKSINKNTSIIDLNRLNLLHNESNQFGALELGLTKVNRNLVNKAEVLYCMELDKDVINTILESITHRVAYVPFLTYKNDEITTYKLKKAFGLVMIYHHFNNSKLYYPNIILPTFHLEQSKGKYYINTEGKAQRSTISVNSCVLDTIVNNTTHFNYLTTSLINGKSCNLKQKSRIIKLVPCINTTNKIQKSFVEISAHYVLKNKKLYKTNFNTLINNFYDTNTVSKIMKLSSFEQYIASSNFVRCSKMD